MADLLSDCLAAAFDGGPCDVVHVGAGTGSGPLMEGYARLAPRRVVFVEGDPEAAAALQRRAAARPWAEVHATVVAPEDGTVTWHRYSLPALNGPLDALSLTAYYPRLLLRDTQPIAAHGFGSFLERLQWPSGNGRRALVMDVPGQEAALLAALDSQVLGTFDAIVLRGCRDMLAPPAAAAEASVAALQARGWRPAAGSGSADALWPVTLLQPDAEWQQRARQQRHGEAVEARARLLQQALDEAEQARARLTLEVQALQQTAAQRLDALQAERQLREEQAQAAAALQGRLDELTLSRQREASEFEALQAVLGERTDALEARGREAADLQQQLQAQSALAALHLQEAQAAAERTQAAEARLAAVHAALDEAGAARDAALADRDAALAARDTAVAAREAALAAHEQAIGGHREAVVARDAATAALGELRVARQADLDALSAERERAQALLQQMAAQGETLAACQHEADALRQQLAEQATQASEREQQVQALQQQLASEAQAHGSQDQALRAEHAQWRAQADAAAEALRQQLHQQQQALDSLQQRIDAAQAALQASEARVAQQAEQLATRDAQLDEARSLAGMAVKLQTLREVDLQELQDRHHTALAQLQRQQDLLSRLAQRLSSANQYFLQLAEAPSSAPAVLHQAPAKPVRSGRSGRSAKGSARSDVDNGDPALDPGPSKP